MQSVLRREGAVVVVEAAMEVEAGFGSFRKPLNPLDDATGDDGASTTSRPGAPVIPAQTPAFVAASCAQAPIHAGR